MIPPNKLGWMAGVIDLKGRVLRKKNAQRATPQLVLAVESKQMGVIRELSSLTGTRPELQEGRKTPDWMRRSCAEHCPDAHVHVDRYPAQMPAIARWTITGAGAAIVIFNLGPFLLSDQSFYEVMKEAIDNTPLAGQGSGAALASIRRLHELGWELPAGFQSVVETQTVS